MSERYSGLFSLPENLYAAGSPVVIAAGALLKDNQTGKVLAQLKLRNIDRQTIKAATVSVEPLDTVGSPLGAPVTYQYLDLHADRDVDFGQRVPVVLPDAATRSFAASVVQVIFATIPFGMQKAKNGPHAPFPNGWMPWVITNWPNNSVWSMAASVNISCWKKKVCGTVFVEL